MAKRFEFRTFLLCSKSFLFLVTAKMTVSSILKLKLQNAKIMGDLYVFLKNLYTKYKIFLSIYTLSFPSFTIRPVDLFHGSIPFPGHYLDLGRQFVKSGQGHRVYLK